jgi:hypothetical protein
MSVPRRRSNDRNRPAIRGGGSDYHCSGRRYRSSKQCRRRGRSAIRTSAPQPRRWSGNRLVRCRCVPLPLASAPAPVAVTDLAWAAGSSVELGPAPWLHRAYARTTRLAAQSRRRILRQHRQRPVDPELRPLPRQRYARSSRPIPLLSILPIPLRLRAGMDDRLVPSSVSTGTVGAGSFRG